MIALGCYSRTENGKEIIITVYQKYYLRADENITATISIDNFEGKTCVHVIAGGGDDMFFRADCFASSTFEDLIHEALTLYETA